MPVHSDFNCPLSDDEELPLSESSLLPLWSWLLVLDFDLVPVEDDLLDVDEPVRECPLPLSSSVREFDDDSCVFMLFTRETACSMLLSIFLVMVSICMYIMPTVRMETRDMMMAVMAALLWAASFFREISPPNSPTNGRASSRMKTNTNDPEPGWRMPRKIPSMKRKIAKPAVEADTLNNRSEDDEDEDSPVAFR